MVTISSVMWMTPASRSTSAHRRHRTESCEDREPRGELGGCTQRLGVSGMPVGRRADRYYDIKGVHADWPPFSNVRDKSQPFRGAYDPANNGRWIVKLKEQIAEKGRIVILDVRNASQAAIDDIKSIVEKNGWEDDVIWCP